MAVIKGVVLETEGRKVKILTNEGEFRIYRQKKPPEVGTEIEKLEIGEYLVYTLVAVLIFTLTVYGFKYLTGGF
ncbi:MAG: anti-sigma factor domain-containing protein [Ignavibacteriales bacterium]